MTNAHMMSTRMSARPICMPGALQDELACSPHAAYWQVAHLLRLPLKGSIHDVADHVHLALRGATSLHSLCMPRWAHTASAHWSHAVRSADRDAHSVTMHVAHLIEETLRKQGVSYRTLMHESARVCLT